jgi:hypothetical protein
MHIPLSTATELSALPESWAPESESPLDDPLLEELPLEDPLLEEPLLDEPLLEEVPLEVPLLEEVPLEEPLPEELPLDVPLLEELPLEEPLPEAPSGAAPSLDSEAPGELVPQAGTRGAVTSAKLQTRTDRAFMLAGQAIPMPCSLMPEMPGRWESRRSVGWTLVYDIALRALDRLQNQM